MSRRAKLSLLSAALLVFPFVWAYSGIPDCETPSCGLFGWVWLLMWGLGAAAALAMRPFGVVGALLSLMNLLSFAGQAFMMRYMTDWL